tara:strand:+ start:4460 stop:5416 length:957 start_codon:yes stop_codon:yes gene_type:complete
MKTLKYTVIIAISILFCNVNAQEKKIKFNKGTLKICSSKNFQIEGYDGDEVIIKSLHEKRESNLNFIVQGARNFTTSKNSSKNVVVRGTTSLSKSSTDSIKTGNLVFFNNDSSRKIGLQKLGKKHENSDLGIFFTIEQNGDELVFKDQNQRSFIMSSNEKYQVRIPNSIKLNWQTNACENKKTSTNQYRFFSSNESSLSNFDGEVEISSTLNNMKLVDVTGPVSINSIGGNVTIEFDKKTPKKLYSIYSNNGFIDITLPSNSDVLVDGEGNAIYSDIDFKVLEEKDDVGKQTMKLKLKNGKVKMKLNAGLGSIYLRKK